MVPTSVLVLCGLLSAFSVDPAWSASGPVIQQCPTHGEIAPCVCTVKKNGGLDILCEFTDLQHISKTMAVLKGKPSLVIFYLKLRHNNLPKLQGFVFLGMDIRHLTIHNSTLAVVEESSLSSIGEHDDVDDDFSTAVIENGALIGRGVWRCGSEYGGMDNIELSPANTFGLSGWSPTNIDRLFELSPFSLLAIPRTHHVE